MATRPEVSRLPASALLHMPPLSLRDHKCPLHTAMSRSVPATVPLHSARTACWAALLSAVTG